MKTPPSLSQTCDALIAALSSPASALSIVLGRENRAQLENLFRGVRELDARVSAMEAEGYVPPWLAKNPAGL